MFGLRVADVGGGGRVRRLQAEWDRQLAGCKREPYIQNASASSPGSESGCCVPGGGGACEETTGPGGGAA